MRDKRMVFGVAALALGFGLNALDSYFSGNLSFSPPESDQNNKLSLLNRLGKTSAERGLTLGTIVAVIGAGILVLTWIVKSKK